MAENQNTRYSTAQIAALFEISLETVRTWCTEFERHLSPRANPGHRRNRAFTEEDLEVLALVSELKDDGLTFHDIHIALDNGQRGEAPTLADAFSDALVPREVEARWMVQVQKLETQLANVKTENERLHTELEEVRRDSLRHEVRAEMLHEQLEKTEKRMNELLDERSRLEREIGSMESDLRHKAPQTGDKSSGDKPAPDAE